VSHELPRYVLDSFARLAYLDGEPGGSQVQTVLTQAALTRSEVYLSLINYGESIYIVECERGLTAAHRMIAAVDQLPITVIDADRTLIFAAAHLKAQYPISYADGFAVALAQQQQAILLTGDPELHKVAHLILIHWLPPN
jgi:ribonuclease VapC